MAHSLTPAPLPATVPISTASRDKSQCPSLGFQRVWLCHQGCDGDLDYKLVHRRAVTLGIAGAVLGLNVSNRSGSAAARRPPPPSPEERRDPNLSGVQVKVLASKKRKEAMKEAVGKLRERGKPVDGPTGSE
ncbi:hypothetical protein I3843_02G084900 [Carya illinoinensis]|uniref:Uncharacterized protein n=1 Tax=Carya illinoinensis TaxID=32201 RepID=A0A8T1RAP5_CARIL|nr:uncharacterized protein LOC122300581 [Carya illinoinensis]KAG2721846.1 hypothetical protein I3760_02G100200 [Carya illinoinensis]KAG6664540.1 hypothetical protein CIPAW_02G100000 [Carya illinoinensis]KAG6726807.1 hypothetical protein I3842_02G098300 [Carya illinoinensis]KAG7991609.1 hypothetical protein I3843_02G084900 [Carya illinoinensis]